MSDRIITNIRERLSGPCSACGDGDTDLRYHNHEPRKLAIVINLDHLRQRMATFVAEVAPHDPTAYTIPFETYLQWERRQRQEGINGSTDSTDQQ